MMQAPIGQDFALLTSNVIATLDDMLVKGRQFYVMPVNGVWFFFYHGAPMVH